MTEPHQNLQILRNYTSREDWKLCVSSLKQLIPYISQYHLSRIILKGTKKYLSAILEFHQDENIINAIRELENIQSFDELTNKASLVFEFIKNKHNDPGIGNYKQALADLSTIPRLQYASAPYFDLIVSIIISLLKALSSADCGYHNPELWLRWTEQESRENTLMPDQTHAFDPANTEFTKSLWVEIADDINLGF